MLTSTDAIDLDDLLAAAAQAIIDDYQNETIDDCF